MMATFLYVLIICSLVQKVSFQAYKVDDGEIFIKAVTLLWGEIIQASSSAISRARSERIYRILTTREEG